MFNSVILEENIDFKEQINEILQLKDIVARYILLTQLYQKQAETMLMDIACVENDKNKDEQFDSINELLDLSAVCCDIMSKINRLYNETGLTDVEVDDLINPASIQYLQNKNISLTNTLLSRMTATPSKPWVSSYDMQMGLFKKPSHIVLQQPLDTPRVKQ